MKRTTVMIPDDLDDRLRREARRRGVSIADVAREALERHLPERQGGVPGFFAIGDGGPADVSERVEEFVAAAISRAHPAGPA
ncbi:MAG: CopG family transcriptional regulator [Sporichthyaceae bacterium]